METKRVLLLTCPTGQGHNAAAAAIAEYLEAAGVLCSVCDALATISPTCSRFISWGHVTLYRHAPRLFDWGWQQSLRRVGMFSPGTGLYRLLARSAGNLYAMIAEGGYTTVICTHALPAVMMTHLLSVHPLDIETAFVATDCTVYPSMEATDMDTCFLPTPVVTQAYMERGVRAASIRYASIPVARQHFAETDRGAACRALGLDPNRRQLLLMSGSMGCGPLAALVRDLVADRPPDSEITVVCGTNRRLCQKLTRRYASISALHIVGFTQEVPQYMAAADLLLTKPGGISMTEAAVHALPMVLVAAVAGCETDNCTYLLNRGAAVTAATPSSLAAACRRLLRDDTARAHMAAALRADVLGSNDGAATIGQAVLHGLKGESHETLKTAPLHR